MNLHAFLDEYTVSLAALLMGRRRYFSQSVDSPPLAELLETTHLTLPDIEGEGVYEVTAETVVGRLDPAFRLAQWLGPEHPTLIYHHGSNERPFEEGRFSKNTFKKVILDHREQFAANLIALRAPWHRSLRTYMERVTELRSFAAMLAVSVQMVEALQAWSRAQGSPRVLVAGISLGGWVTNLHRAYRNTADIYAPMLAGAALDELFVSSAYRRLTGEAARQNPERVRHALNFEEAFAAVPVANVFALLARHDRIIVYERQRQSYGDHPITVLDKGHTTATLDADALSRFLLAQLDRGV